MGVCEVSPPISPLYENIQPYFLTPPYPLSTFTSLFLSLFTLPLRHTLDNGHVKSSQPFRYRAERDRSPAVVLSVVPCLLPPNSETSYSGLIGLGFRLSPLATMRGTFFYPFPPYPSNFPLTPPCHTLIQAYLPPCLPAPILPTNSLSFLLCPSPLPSPSRARAILYILSRLYYNFIFVLYVYSVY